MFRIVTENRDAAGVRALLVGLGLDFTSYTGVGCYKGQLEDCLMLEFVEAPRATVEHAAQCIGRMNGQECILLQEIVAVSALRPIQPERPALAVSAHATVPAMA